MEFKADALMLRSADYGENDKMVTLLTAERGKLGARVRGVKKAGAKLRFAAQPFCFAEYVLAERSGRYTVISASLYDGFYALCEDVAGYYAAAAVAEACDKLSYESMPCGSLLVAAVAALGEICRGEPLALVRFLLGALTFAGYPVRTGACPACGSLPKGRMRFDFESGSFFCGTCFEGGVPASESTYACLRAAEKRGAADPDGIVRALRLLRAYFTHHTGAALPALEAYQRIAAQ